MNTLIKAQWYDMTVYGGPKWDGVIQTNSKPIWLAHDILVK